MLKRSLITVLVISLVAAYGSIAFAAASTVVAPAFSDIAATDGEFALAALGALGVFSGDKGVGGPVRPADSITRAEFAKVVVVGMGKGSVAAGLSGLAPAFKDGVQVPAWAWGYVNSASMMGVINGYPDGTFKAGNPVTYAEAIAMLTRAVGGHTAQIPAGAWPYNYVWYGLDNGFTGDVEISFPNLPASRGDMAIMTLATMGVDRLNADGDVVHDTAALKGREFEGTLLSYDLTGNRVGIDLNKDGDATDEGESMVLASKVYLAKATNLEGLRMLAVEAFTGTGANAGKVVFLGPTEGTASAYRGVLEVVGYHPAGDTTGYDYLKFADATLIPYSGAVAVKLNEHAGHDLGDLAAGDVVAVSKNASGLAVNLDAQRNYDFDSGAGIETRAWATNVTKATTETGLTSVTVAFKGGASAVTVKVPASARLTVNGATGGRNDLAKWDVLYVGFENNVPNADRSNVVFVSAVRKAVSGTVAAARTSYTADGSASYCTIDAKEYEYELASGPSVGDMVTYGLDADGIAYAPISYTQPTWFWLVKSYIDTTDPTPGDSVGLDIAGTAQTYRGDGTSFSANIGYVGFVQLDSQRRIKKIQSADSASDFTGPYDVVAADAANGYVIYDDGGTDRVLYIGSGGVIYLAGDHYVSGTGYVSDLPEAASFLGVAGLRGTDKIFISKNFADADGDGTLDTGAGQVILVQSRDVE